MTGSQSKLSVPKNRLYIFSLEYKYSIYFRLKGGADVDGGTPLEIMRVSLRYIYIVQSPYDCSRCILSVKQVCLSMKKGVFVRKTAVFSQ